MYTYIYPIHGLLPVLTVIFQLDYCVHGEHQNHEVIEDAHEH